MILRTLYSSRGSDGTDSNEYTYTSWPGFRKAAYSSSTIYLRDMPTPTSDVSIGYADDITYMISCEVKSTSMSNKTATRDASEYQ